MSCTQQKQLVSFPKVRVQKHWFRYHFDHKEFANEGTLHLFSLMALYSYANFRSDSCGMRELKSWVLSTMVTNDPYESAMSTIIGSASSDPDNRAELISTCLDAQFSRK